MEEVFKTSVIEALQYYVYCLVDPRTNRIFYIGKGSGNRIFNHANDALNDNLSSLKLNIIREIRSSGQKVSYYIIRHGLNKDEALLVESVLIDMLTYEKFNTESILANIQSGHHQWDEGIKSIEEINAIYNCDKIDVNNGDTLLLVSLNRSFNQAKADGVYRRVDIYEATRKYWDNISPKRAPNIKYVLGVYKGVVRSVIEVRSWKWTLIAEDGTKFKRERCIFEGNLLKDSPYLNKDVSDYPFSRFGGSIRYIESL